MSAMATPAKRDKMARIGAQVIDFYAELVDDGLSGSDVQTCVQDLLTELMHFSHRAGFSFPAILDCAHRAFEREQRPGYDSETP